jgi:hypothetical protein
MGFKNQGDTPESAEMPGRMINTYHKQNTMK